MSPDQDLVSHSIQVLAAFLKSEELFSVLCTNSIAIVLATRATECLLLALSGMLIVITLLVNGAD
jgi:ubiquitin carboxyl-terminal hydrolase 34